MTLRHRFLLLFFFPLTTSVLAQAVDLQEPGTRKQLLVDNLVISDLDNIQRVLGTVTRLNQGKPIFTDGKFYGTVVYDQGRFKMWWRKPEQQGFGYAESQDGIHFTRLADLSGINFAGDYTLSVTVDGHETDPAHRYKAAYDAPGMAAGIAHSADGIRWTPYNDGKPVTHRAADTYNQITWDSRAQTYRLFTRTDFGTAGGATEVRGVRSMTNPDPRGQPANWKMVRNWIFDREGPEEISRRQIYALTDWQYHDIHFALMTVYEWPGDSSEGPADLVKRHERDVINYYIGTSRDGDSWDLGWVYAGKPFLPRGPDGSFDKDMILPSSSIVTHQDRHWIYYSGANERHGTPEVSYPRESFIGVATLPLDRFIGLASQGDQPGTVVTRPFKLLGSNLQLNIAAPTGSYRVEILDAEGKPLKGFAGRSTRLYHRLDELRHQPRWKGKNLASLAGRTIRLRFTLDQATLYSFQVLP
jgi:hypothetical protein